MSGASQERKIDAHRGSRGSDRGERPLAPLLRGAGTAHRHAHDERPADATNERRSNGSSSCSSSSRPASPSRTIVQLLPCVDAGVATPVVPRAAPDRTRPHHRADGRPRGSTRPPRSGHRHHPPPDARALPGPARGASGRVGRRLSPSARLRRGRPIATTMTRSEVEDTTGRSPSQPSRARLSPTDRGSAMSESEAARKQDEHAPSRSPRRRHAPGSNSAWRASSPS